MIGRGAKALLVLVCAPAVMVAQSSRDSVCRLDTVWKSVDTIAFSAVAPAHDPRVETAAEYAFRLEQARRVTPFLAGALHDAVLDLHGTLVQHDFTGGSLVDDSTSIVQSASTHQLRTNALRWNRASRLWFQVNDAGRLSAARIDVASRDSVVNVALARAVLAADSARALAPLPDSLAHDPIDLWLALTPEPDTSAFVVLQRDVMRGRVELDVVEYRGTQGSSVEPPRRVSGPPLEFPETGQDLLAGDRVTVAFVIGWDGRVVPPTVHVVSAQSSAFADEAVRLLSESRYRPERVMGCPVDAEVQEQFSFRPR